jgi:K+ transporter
MASVRSHRLPSTAVGAAALIALLGIGGAALFHGNAAFTPAISVLSGTEEPRLRGHAALEAFSTAEVRIGFMEVPHAP